MKKYRTLSPYFGYLIERNAFGIWYKYNQHNKKIVSFDITCLNRSLYFFETKQLWL